MGEGGDGGLWMDWGGRGFGDGGWKLLRKFSVELGFDWEECCVGFKCVDGSYEMMRVGGEDLVLRGFFECGWFKNNYVLGDDLEGEEMDGKKSGMGRLICEDVFGMGEESGVYEYSKSSLREPTITTGNSLPCA
ncbi:hypothetical protein Tco_0345176 [Tanacetum coccineum]